MNMEVNGRYIEKLNHFLNGDSSLEDEKELLTWLESEEGNEYLNTYYQKKWEETSDKDLSEEIQRRMYRRIKTQMKEVEVPKVLGEKTYFFSMLKYAAVALAFLCLGISFNYIFPLLKGNDSVMPEYIVKADKGQKASVILPDGTKVWLNSHSELRYTADYGKEIRNIKLIGEAYFKVSSDKVHPFIVHAGDMKVQALGTTFDVKAYKEDGEVITSLYEGKVLASVGEKVVIVNPNEQVCYQEENKLLEKRVSDNLTYNRLWMDNELSFDKETMEEIALRLNRLYNIYVEFEDEKIKQYCFSGVIKNNSLDNVFEIISLTIPIQYVTNEDTIKLSLK